MQDSGGSAPQSPPRADRIASFSSSKAFAGLIALALAVGLLRRLAFGFDTPLWLDEAFTGAIAIQPRFGDVIADALGDVPGPVYYSLMWGWEKIFGASNFALRAPSLLFAVLAPLVILFKGHPDKLTRQLWAAFAALSVPTFLYAADARAYTLLFLLGAVQIPLFMQMLRTPTLRNAAIWAGFAAFFVLTHYHSILLTAFQGLAYLAVRRQEALRTWPAALLFAPAGLWMFFHLPLVARFTTAEVAWQTLLGFGSIPSFPWLLLGIPKLSALIIAVIGVTALWEAYRRMRDRSPFPIALPEALAVAASLTGVAIVLGMGFIRPNFAPRYLMPFMPGVLLGFAIWARVLTERFRTMPWIVVVGLLACVAFEARVRAGERDFRAKLSWERASADMTKGRVDRLIYFWDNPVTVVISPALLGRVGTFFFDRQGIAVSREPVVLTRPDVNPNRALLATADRPGDAIIWVFDMQVPSALANRYPPALHKLDPTLDCRDYSSRPHGVVVCRRRAGA